jgi:DNA mismatch endonuclease (patch repair protein)
MDHLDPTRRSANMARVRGKDTGPEIVVRRLAHRLGLRFRLHRKDLPGRPDLVFPKYRLVVFVHGCFWHRHSNCKRATTPATRQAFWQAKFDATVARDARQQAQLEAAGWRVVTLWECELKDEASLGKRLLDAASEQ